MQRWTVIFLVLLRLSIGWHFLFEGLNKIQSFMVGPTVTNKPFSSAGYFREATGPLGSAFRAVNGDPDDEALARLVTKERDGDPANDKPHLRLPPGLRRDWQGVVQRYAKHYGFAAAEADAVLDQHASTAVGWLEYEPDSVFKEVLSRFGKIENVDTTLLDEKERAAYEAFLNNSTDQTVTFSTGDVKRRMTMAERIADYRAKLADLRDRSSRKLWRFGRDVEGARLRAAKAELTKLRTGLMDDLDQTQTAALIQALNNLAVRGAADDVSRALKDPAFKGYADVMKMPTTPIDPRTFADRLKDLQTAFGKEIESFKDDGKPESQQRLTRLKEDAAALDRRIKEGVPTVGPLPAPQLGGVMADSDWYLACGLTAIGACLLAGLLTRTACWLAALFLLMTYLAVPPLPWLPVAGPQEGNYVFVNKNVVEMLALCVLGTLPTGRWFGADGLLWAFWRWITGTTSED